MYTVIMLFLLLTIGCNHFKQSYRQHQSDFLW